MIMKAQCADCLLGKWRERCPGDAGLAAREYLSRIEALVRGNETLSSPEMDTELEKIYESMFGQYEDYGPIKRRFNALMLAQEADMRAGVLAAGDPLARAVQYAMAGNFIDFAVLGSVDEGELRRLLDESSGIRVDPAALEALRGQVMSAGNLLYMTDNCGEIVTDKVLMWTLGQLNPAIRISAMVRGLPVVNDATREDAGQVGLDEVAQDIVDSGCGYAGNPLNRISRAARRAIDSAELLIAKGQANYEALNGNGLNMFYIFMCKCQLFMDRFQVPRFAGMLTKEDF